MSLELSSFKSEKIISQYASLIGRLLLASFFIYAGLSKLTGLEGVIQYIESKSLPYPSALAWLAIAVELIGGTLIVIGYKAKIAALSLAIFTLITAFIFHNYWSLPADQQHLQSLLFIKNISIAGGLLFLSAIGSGSLSLDKELKPVESAELAIN